MTASETPVGVSRLRAYANRSLQVRPEEFGAVLLSCLFIFSVMSAYYVLRPIRDEMGIAGGVDKLPWLFTGTLLAMLAANPLFAMLVKKFPRQTFITVSYRFFMFNLLCFALYLEFAPSEHHVWTGRVFFIWISVFNLFVVSVFWAFIVDIFDAEQGKRLFGLFAAGATIGAILGSSLTSLLVSVIGQNYLLFFSIALLEIGVFAVHRLTRLSKQFHHQVPVDDAREDRPVGGSVLAGFTHTLASPYLLGIGIFMLIYSVTSTVIYFQQAEIVRDAFANRAERVAFFARVDLLVNILTLTLQIFATGRILRRFGVAITLSALPLISLLGFGLLALWPTLTILVVAQVGRRVGNFAFARPSREMLFTVVSREDKYKTKNFLDTVVYRTGDQFGSWSYAFLGWLGLKLAGIAIVILPICALWMGLSAWLGRQQKIREAKPVET